MKVIHATTEMNPENIMLSERRQMQKLHIAWFHFYKMSRIGKSMEMESRLVIAHDWKFWGKLQVTNG